MIIRYLDIHARVLLENCIDMAEEFRTGVDRHRRQSSFLLLLLQRMFEFELGYSQHGCSTLCFIDLGHGCCWRWVYVDGAREEARPHGNVLEVSSDVAALALACLPF